MLRVTPKIAPVNTVNQDERETSRKGTPCTFLGPATTDGKGKQDVKVTDNPQPICSRIPPVITSGDKFGLIIGIDFPIEIINPAAGMTAITTIKALPNFARIQS